MTVINDFLWGCLFGLMVAYATSFLWIIPAIEDGHYADAIKHNAARYEIIDQTTGKTQFKWNDEK